MTDQLSKLSLVGEKFLELAVPCLDSVDHGGQSMITAKKINGILEIGRFETLNSQFEPKVP